MSRMHRFVRKAVISLAVGAAALAVACFAQAGSGAQLADSGTNGTVAAAAAADDLAWT